MNPFRLFLSFSGRIGRLAFWIGMILLAALTPFSIATVTSDNPVRETLAAVQTFGFAGFAWSLALIFAVSAILVKRLHDRGRSGIYAALFYLPAAVSALTYFGGDGLPLVADAITWTSWIAWLTGASGLGFLVALGLMPGQRGPNKYGPDPRGRERA